MCLSQRCEQEKVVSGKAAVSMDFAQWLGFSAVNTQVFRRWTNSPSVLGGPFQYSASQSVAPGPPGAASPENLMKNPNFHPQYQPSESEILVMGSGNLCVVSRHPDYPDAHLSLGTKRTTLKHVYYLG